MIYTMFIVCDHTFYESLHGDAAILEETTPTRVEMLITYNVIIIYPL